MLTVIFWLFYLLFVCASIVLIFVVLIQSGKGGGLSGLVGAGTTLGDHLGATGAEKTLNRWTTYCAVGFLIFNILLVVLGPSVYRGSRSVLDELKEQLPPSEKPAGQASATTATAESAVPVAGAPEASNVGAPPAGTPDTSQIATIPGPEGAAPQAGTVVQESPAASTQGTPNQPAPVAPSQSTPATANQNPPPASSPAAP